jgi:caa(3)-type oxidase subunit IV
MGSKNQKHHHPILPTKVAISIGATLLFLTMVTVWVAHIDLGYMNFTIAMAIATLKALLVALFFMGLKYDHSENAMIFVTSFLFLAIFMVLTSTDLFFRGDVYPKKGQPFFIATQGAPSKYKNPWISTPELVAHGKELFMQQCTSCHGNEGKGDGPAASALNPHPRNFTATSGWKNGRKPTMVFKTLKEGLPPSAMASYATLPSDDRWALVQYVLSLAPEPEKDTPADFAKIGIDPSKDGGGGEKVDPTIPLEQALARITVSDEVASKAHLYHHTAMEPSQPATGGAALYRSYCLRCHGDQGKGAIRVETLSVFSEAYVDTAPFRASSSYLTSSEAFGRLVIQGIPGDLMPGVGHLSSSQMSELYQYVRSISR